MVSAHKADLTYLRILHLAAREMECQVVSALGLLLGQAQPFDESHVARLVLPPTPPPPALASLPVNLRQNDALLLGGPLC